LAVLVHVRYLKVASAGLVSGTSTIRAFSQFSSLEEPRGYERYTLSFRGVDLHGINRKAEYSRLSDGFFEVPFYSLIAHGILGAQAAPQVVGGKDEASTVR